MGHVVNAKGTRVGWITNWCDHWFTELQFYPECLHSIFRIRFFLIYFFDLRFFERNGILYSHFEIIKYYKQFYINIFYYDSKLHQSYSDFYFEFFIKIKMEYKIRKIFLRRKILYIQMLYIFFLFDKSFYLLQKMEEKTTFKDVIFFFLKGRGMNRSKLINLSKEEKKVLNKFDRLNSKKKILLDNLDELKIFSSSEEEILFDLKTKWWINFLLGDISSNLKILCYAVSNLKFLKVKSFFNKINTKNPKRKKKYIKLLFFFTLYFLFNFFFLKKKKDLNMLKFVRRFFFSYSCYSYCYSLFNYISLFLQYILTYFNNCLNLQIGFYLIDNDTVTAKFLSRFIAKAFQKNCPIRVIVQPILKELKRASASIFSRRAYYQFNNVIPRTIINSNEENWRMSIFKSLLIYIFLLYNNFNFLFFKKNFTWFNLDMLTLYIWLKKNWKKKKIIFLSMKYFIRRSAFIYFFYGIFNNQMQMKTFNKLFLPTTSNNKVSMLNFSPKINLGGFFNFIYEDFFLNKTLIFLTWNKLYYNSNLFLYYQKFLNRFIQYNFWLYNYAGKHDFLGYNNLKERIKKTKIVIKGISGFKIHCLGRFARKQRATSIWFSLGNIPINTIKTNIDFALYTIPLYNSAISIRIWLNDDRIIKWFIKII